MKNKITFLLLLFALLFQHEVTAQDGSNDPTFNPIDTGYANGTDGPISSVIVLPDGKVVIAGLFLRYKGEARHNIARINANESLDLTFNPGSGANGDISYCVLQPNGKIIIAGDFTQYNEQPRNRVARINQDGSLDETFNPGSGANASVNVIALQADGKIILGGDFTNFNGISSSGLLRLQSDGTLDDSFLLPAINNDVSALAIQADGKVLAGGSFTVVDGLPASNVARFNADGTRDNTFAIINSNILSINALAINAQGKIFIGGSFEQINGQTIRGIVCVNENGTINTNFNVGTGFNGWVSALTFQSDGKLIVGGSSGRYNDMPNLISVFRLNIDASLDDTFLNANADRMAYCIKLKPDGKIIIGGGFLSYNNIAENFITCRNPDGSKETFFNIGAGTGADHSIDAILVEPDNKIIVGGAFNNYNGVLRNRIAKLNEDGTLDTSFATGSGFNSTVTFLGRQADGKILVSGNFDSYSDVAVKKMVRLNIDGTLDTSFNLNLPFYEPYLGIREAVIQADGKIVLSGNFVTLNGGSLDLSTICRINANGTYDPGFSTKATDRGIVKMVTLPQNKTLLALGGSFGNSDTYFMLRLNANGTRDTSFTSLPLSYVNSVIDIVQQSDGKIIVTGIVYGQSVVYKMLRLNSDGTLDVDYPIVTLPNRISKLAIQNDDKVIAFGGFGDSDVNIQNNITRLALDGSIDESFNCGTGVIGVNAVAFQSSGKMLLTGSFTSYNETGRNRIARIHANNSLSVEDFIKKDVIAVYKQNDLVVINSFKEIARVVVYDLTGRLVAQKENIGEVSASVDKISSKSSILLIRVQHADGSIVNKKIYF